MLSAAWSKGLLPRPDLAQLAARADALAAKQRAGAPPVWHEALGVLLGSLRVEAKLNPIGLTFAYVQLVGLLKQRERAHALWRRHPEILDIPIERPVIVLGHMRSGTTRLQRLLGCDPRLAHTRFFEVMHPVPGRVDLRVTKSRAQLALLNRLSPESRAIHPTSATAVEEQFGLLSFSFYGAQLEAQWRVPTFARAWERRDPAWVYREFRQLLQTLAWYRGDRGTPWVLKAPQFMEDLAALLEVFPDASLICLNRDVAEVVGSSASLVWNQMKLQSDEADPRWVGEEWLHKTARRERRCRAVRLARPDVPQIELAYDAVNADWLGEMRRVYAFLGLELTSPIQRQMSRYLLSAERSGFRRHRYRLEDFGLSADAARTLVGG